MLLMVLNLCRGPRKSHDESLTEILSTIDQFQDELKKSSVISAGTLEASNPGQQLAYTIFTRIIYAAMSVLRPHRDVGFSSELSAVKTTNQTYDMKFQEMKEKLNETCKEAGVQSPRLLFPGVGDMTNTRSLPNADGPTRSELYVCTPAASPGPRNQRASHGFPRRSATLPFKSKT